MSDKTEAAYLLLEDCNEDTQLGSIHPSRTSSRLQTTFAGLKILATHLMVALAVFVFLSFNQTIFFPSAAQGGDNQPTRILYSPLNKVISYQIDKPPFDYWSNQLYFGKPSVESEKAWNDLLHPHGLQMLPGEVRDHSMMDTIYLKNGNPLYILSVIHNLHCLRRIHQTLYSDHYYSKATEAFREHDLEHTEHCLESLRTSLMCNPDLTPNRFYWSNHAIHNMSVAPDVTRECVDWSAVAGFLKERAYDEDNDLVRD